MENVNVAERADECPDAGEISPCTCSLGTNGLIMDCSLVKTSEILQSIFEKPFPSDNFYQFTMNQQGTQSEIIALEEQTFGSKTFQRSEMRYINFNVSVDIFDKMTETLEVITFYETPFTTFIKDYNSFSKLRELYLQYSQIGEISVQSKTLEILFLIDAKLEETNKDISYNLGQMENLLYLNIGINYLNKSPDTSMYPKLNKLYYHQNKVTLIEKKSSTENYLDQFNAADNLIEDFEVDAIPVATGGRVYLDGNQLTQVDQLKFENMFMNATYVWFFNNPFECGCDVQWLIQNQIYMDKLHSATQCANGTLFTDLDQDGFNQC